MAKKKEVKEEKDKEGATIEESILAILGNSFSGSDDVWNCEILPTGILGLDKALVGGFRYGCMAELYGEQHTGKSVLLQLALRNNQLAGGQSILFDSEGAYNPALFAALGGNPDTLRVRIGFTVEEMFDEIINICELSAKARKRGGVVPKIAIGWDSIANTPTENLEEDRFKKRDFSKASANSDGCKLLGGKLRESGVAFIATNQIREKIGADVYAPVHTPGGRAILHYASQRIELKFDGGYGAGGSALKAADGTVIGRKVRGTIHKNRAGLSSRQFHFQIWMESGHPNPEIDNKITKMGIDEDEAALVYYLEDYANFGKDHKRYLDMGGGGYYTWAPEVVAALGKPADWKFAKFRRKQWDEVIADAPQLRDPNLLT